MALEFGLTRGLAARVNGNALVDDVYKQYSLERQLEQQQQAKAKMFADDFDYNNSTNAHDNPIVKEFARKKIYEIGDYIRKNPGWEKTIEGRMNYKNLLRELKDNPDLNRGMLSDQGYKLWQADLAEKSKNPQLFNAAANAEIAKQWQNYEKYGNQDGEDAAKNEGKKAFRYVAAKDFVDLDKAAGEYGNNFKDFEIADMPGGFLGAWKEVPKEQSVKAVVDNFYSLNKQQLDQQAASRGYANGADYANKLIRANIRGRFDMGSPSASVALQKIRATQNGNIPNPGSYKLGFVNKKEGDVPASLLYDIYGQSPRYAISNNNGSNVIDMTGQPVNYTGYHKNIDGRKFVQIQTDIPREKALELGIARDPWGFGDFEVSQDWQNKGQVVKVTNKAGDKEIEVFRYNGLMPVDVNNATYQQMWDKKTMTAQDVPGAQEDYEDVEMPLSGSGKYKWNGKEWIPNK